MPKKVIFGLVAVLILAIGAYFFYFANKNGSSGSACQEVAGSVQVVMNDDSFEPKSLKIKNCMEVTFLNESSEAKWPASNLHPTHGIYPEFDPKQGIGAGGNWKFVFDRVGIFKYHDHLKPQVTGEITVEQ